MNQSGTALLAGGLVAAAVGVAAASGRPGRRATGGLVNATALRPGRFTTDSGEAGPFAGWSHPAESWNGAAVPYFSREEGARIAAANDRIRERHGVDMAERISYDRSRDAFLLYPEDDERPSEEVRGGVHTTTAGPKHLYGIGARAWMWREVRR